MIPKTATTEGKRNGAPSSATIAPRPGNRRRASARAAGTASATLRAAEMSACTTVKRSADHSAGPRPRPGSARSASTATVPRVSAATSASAMPPPAARRSPTG